MVHVLVNLPMSTDMCVINAETTTDIYDQVATILASVDFRLVIEGSEIDSMDVNSLDRREIEVEIEVVGGKGGFGSLLRIAAAQKKHFKDFDACRDSTGRRLRDIKNELRLMEFVKKKKNEQDILQKDDVKDDKEVIEHKRNVNNIVAAKIDEVYTSKTKTWEQKFNSTIREAYLGKRQKKADEEEMKENTDEKVNNLGLANARAKLLLKRVRKQQEVMHEQKVNTSSKGISPKKIVKSKQEPSSKHLDSKPLTDNRQHQVSPIYTSIDLQKVPTIDDLNKYGDEHIKHELKRLGIKVGGLPKDRLQRLWDIKCNPSNLLNPKYIAKSK